MRYDAVFFDFDGVILDSVEIKTEAFAQMFRHYGPRIEREVVRYHREHGGVSRHRKFAYFYEHLLKEPLDTEKLAELTDTFSRLVLEKVLAAPFIDGARETLDRLKAADIPAYIVSGTPEQEMRHIVRERDLTHYFRGVFGSPDTKAEIVRCIIAEGGYDPARCLFFGDAMTDYDAAKDGGVPFVGVVPQGRQSPFPEGTVFLSAVQIDVE